MSVTSRGNLAVNVLTIFSTNNNIPLYKFLQLAFFASIACCIFSIIGSFYVADLPWDSTLTYKNPLNDTMNLYSIQMLTAKLFLIQSDVNTYQKSGKQLNKTRISEYFGSSDYTTSVVELINEV